MPIFTDETIHVRQPDAQCLSVIMCGWYGAYILKCVLVIGINMNDEEGVEDEMTKERIDWLDKQI